MKSDFSSDLAPFLAIIGWGGGGAPREIKSYAPVRSFATLPPEYWAGRRPSGVDSFHATPIGVVLENKNSGWDVSHTSHLVAEPIGPVLIVHPLAAGAQAGAVRRCKKG